MKILAIDSSGLTASIAVLSDGRMAAEYTITDKKTHSQTLLPMIDTIEKMLGDCLQEVDAIAVAKGPGSFTGLRIGSATAKGLAFVWKKPIIPVPTVDAIAYNLYGTQSLICPLMDARRNQAYTGIYTFEQKEASKEMPHLLTADLARCRSHENSHFVRKAAPMEFCVLSEQKAAALEEILSEVNNLADKRKTGVIFLGDGVPVFQKQIEETMQVPFSFAPAHCQLQRAGAVGTLGMLYYEKGIMEPPEAHVPEYLRLSQAEREREEKIKAVQR